MILTRNKAIFLFGVAAFASTMVGAEERKSTFSQDQSTSKVLKTVPGELETYAEQGLPNQGNQHIEIGYNGLRTALAARRVRYKQHNNGNIIRIVNRDN